ncbi:MAG: hypothetical protein RRC34_08635 [Lentisphaeria bacterium]|nr:hypothetical protein [Lentisphaeria bacterium]
MKNHARLVSLFIFLLLLSASAQEEALTWRQRFHVPSSTGNLYFTHQWDTDTGLRLRFSDPSGGLESVILIAPGAYEIRVPPAAGLPLPLKTPPRVNKSAFPEKAGAVEITVKFRESEWAFFVDNRRLLTISAPFSAPADLQQPVEDIPAEDDDDLFFQKTEPFTFTDDFLVPEGEGGALSAWTKAAGVWELHTAVDNSVARQTIVQGAAKHPEPSRSPNFYSLRGSGSPGIITAGYDFHDDYAIEAALLTQVGEAGLVFYSRDGAAAHAFTISLVEGAPKALFRLWRSSDTDCRVREVFGAATADVPLGQWVKLKVVIQDNRVRCFMDHTRVFDAQLSLPAGGMYGLFTHAEEPIRFDDVSVSSFRDLDLRGVEGLLGHAKRITGAFAGDIKRKGWFKRKRQPRLTLSLPHDHPGGELVIGAYTHDPHYFKCDVTPLETAFTVGLVVGHTGPDTPHFRLVYAFKDGREHFQLEKHVPGKTPHVLDSFTVPAAEEHLRLSLACDTTEPGIIKFYRNGTLVLGTLIEDSLTGASGVWVPEDSKVAFASFEYDFSPPPVFRNKFEKNRTFATDPFMRHWSSPEGEWITLPDKTTWFKSDFHGRFAIHMPYVENSSVHFSVPEGEMTGELTARVEKEHVNLYRAADGQPPELVASVPVASLKPGGGPPDSSSSEVKLYAVDIENHLVRITSGGETLATFYLPEPLTGRCARVEGFSTRDLMHSRVDRYNVQDFLFNESLHNWTLNGGSWEIVNRFQCQPRWSHMNGESAHGLAALWNKYAFKGDFCLEMYAGMRHGWYERAGDLNMTIMNTRGTPSEGYTITTTGWDPDHSQLWTTLYKNGKELARSSKYLVPRIREDNERRGYNPLLSSARPIHGAWYYLKLRRVNDVMEFYFDNELVFSVRDPDPISMGSLGIWTYMNSMMVARVKCAAEDIRAKSIPVTKVPLDYQLTAQPAPGAGGGGLLDQNNQPYPLTGPSHWTARDEVGQAALTWHTDKDGTPYMTVESRLGGGGFFAACDNTPAAPVESIAGWFMLVKRTRGARFNFHYALGRQTRAGDFLPERHLFHHLSGSDLETSGYLKGGETAIPSDIPPGPDWHTRGEWTPVIVWIDDHASASSQATTGWSARPEGFGNPQPSYVSQGLLGNAPGEAYAVKNVTPIRFDKPVFTAKSSGSVSFSVYNQQGKGIGETTDIDAVNAMLPDSPANPGLRRFYIRAQAGDTTVNFPVWWIHPPPLPDITMAWHETDGGKVTFTTPPGIPDHRFLRLGRATANGMPVALEQTAINKLEGHLPKHKSIHADSPLELRFEAGSYHVSDQLDWHQVKVPAVPVLMDLKGPLGIALSFDDRAPAAPLVFDAKRMTIREDPGAPGSYLRVSNQGAASRLQTQINQSLDLSRFPLLQFNYRGGAMANVSLSAGRLNQIAFSEDRHPGKTVRLADTGMIQDDQWHAWLGMLPDAVKGGTSITKTFDIPTLVFRSYDKRDQTGLYATLDVDNVVAGPVISSPDQLILTPDYYAPQGVKQVMFCVYSGATPYMNLPGKDRDALRWSHTVPGEPIQLRHLPPDGVAHMLLKARGAGDRDSAVFDVPFLVDTTPPKVTCSLRSTANPATNGQILNVAIDCDQGAPLDPAQLGVTWNGHSGTLEEGMARYAHAGKTGELEINWPRVFREQLKQTRDGDLNRITVTGIRDGAGNRLADMSLPVVTNYAKDQLGPASLPARLPASVLWRGDWLDDSAIGLAISVKNSLSLHTELGASSYVEAKNQAGDLQVWKAFSSGQWHLTKYPLFAFNIRRPKHAGEQDRVKVELFVSFNRRELYVFPVGGDTDTGSLNMTLGRSFDWSEKTWTGGVIDLEKIMLETLTRQLIRDATRGGTYKAGADSSYRAKAAETLARQSVRMVGFRVVGAPLKDVLHIKDMCVSKDWNDEDVIIFDGYDVSGMAGITVKADDTEKEFSGLTLRPAKTPRSEWLSVRLRDRAGNLGPTHLFPGKR